MQYLGYLVSSCLLLSSVSFAQFIKHVDEQGRVTYTEDPEYDYSMDEPSVRRLQQHNEEQAGIQQFLDERRRTRPSRSVKPSTTVRTGASVCTKTMSHRDIRHNCARPAP